MRAHLTWKDAAGREGKIEVVDRVHVGRTCQGADPQKRIILEDPMVSRDHVLITLGPSGLIVKDVSTNGTWINDVRITQGASLPLYAADTIRLGQSTLIVHCDDVAGGSRPEGVADDVGHMATVTDFQQ